MAQTSQNSAADIAHKPMMSTAQILLMNVGFFGIQYSFGMQQNAMSPIYQFLGASQEELPILNLAGPITGLLIQPIIGALSDRTWSDKWGRRKPFFLIGAVGCSVFLFLMPFVTAVWMAVLCLWLLDASNNTAMEPYRAFIGDRLPSKQLAKGFLAQSLFIGAGSALAAGTLVVLEKTLAGATAAGIPYWVFGAFMVGSVCSIGSVLISVLSTKELPPTPEGLVELERKKKEEGSLGFVRDVRLAIVEMPRGLKKLAIVYLFQWYAMYVFWQYLGLMCATAYFGVDVHQEGYAETAAFNDASGFATGLMVVYYVSCTVVALFLARLANRIGPKHVHTAALCLAAVCLVLLTRIGSPGHTAVLYLPMIGIGVAWASITGVPYIMAIEMIRKERRGVYMGVINMMIVIPQLLQTLTFGLVYKYLLGDHPVNALLFVAVFLIIAGLLIEWIDTVKDADPLVRAAVTTTETAVA
ncbi:MFS transporter [uncultured Actinomyces sp.]|uniref:MFS transporter n=1 Tax=uncultured Actinomyces sp. TaxID=249061 RepID=UPI0028E196D6|nr:MFS transporter [uncultured Actinomyces sp.]